MLLEMSIFNQLLHYTFSNVYFNVVKYPVGIFLGAYFVVSLTISHPYLYTESWTNTVCFQVKLLQFYPIFQINLKLIGFCVGQSNKKERMN